VQKRHPVSLDKHNIQHKKTLIIGEQQCSTLGGEPVERAKYKKLKLKKVTSPVTDWAQPPYLIQ
jgi:hypothetical protein